jgi:hypothetical protein
MQKQMHQDLNNSPGRPLMPALQSLAPEPAFPLEENQHARRAGDQRSTAGSGRLSAAGRGTVSHMAGNLDLTVVVDDRGSTERFPCD